MKTDENFDRFPLWIILLSNIQSVLIYAAGFFILFHPTWWLAIVYLVFVLWLEYRIISKHCVNCYYWGKACGFGKGIVSGWFFKKGNPAHFCEKPMTWKDMIPDMLVSLIPILAGIVILILRFDWIILVAMLLIVVLTTIGNAYIRGSLTCKFCKQRELGCPAEELFDNKTSAGA
jgi:hypothetical protein